MLPDLQTDERKEIVIIFFRRTTPVIELKRFTKNRIKYRVEENWRERRRQNRSKEESRRTFHKK